VTRSRLVHLSMTCRTRPPRSCHGRIAARRRLADAATYQLPQGGTQRIELRLSRRAFALLVRSGSLRLTLTATAVVAGRPSQATALRARLFFVR
jgi:hypothetical protein